MKKLITLVSILLCHMAMQGQYYVSDALRYSQNFPTLTARSMSMGNAFTSLGGDFSSAFINPAGLGLYRKSEFQFSPGLGYSGIKTTYNGEKNDDYKYHFILSSMGYVGTYISGKDKGLVSASYAVGYNRLNNFQNNTYIKGDNTSSAFADYFWDNADGNDPDSLDVFAERLAFDAYVIDTIPGTAFEYFNVVGNLPVTQQKIIETTGGTGEWSFGFGLNFSNIMYVGMGLGIYQLNYSQKNITSEFDDYNLNDFSFYHFTEDLDVKGTGFSLKMGLMLRPVEFLRIGASLHLPTFYRIEEVFTNSMYSEFDNGFIPSEEVGGIYAEGTYVYKLHTPLKLMGGASIQIGKSGIVAADIEYIDYSNMRLREKDILLNSRESNRTIEDVYRKVVNLKLGGELRFGNLSLRAGGGLYPSPYTSDELNKNAGYGELTTGLGYRDSNFFFDLGFSALFNEEKYNLYFNNVADMDQSKYRFIGTIGFRF